MNTYTRRALLIVPLAFIAWAISAGAARAQYTSSVGSSDGQNGPQLRLSTNSSVYRQGELIPLDLAFTAETPNRYRLDLSVYDRNGRSGTDKFVIDPSEGSEDPLEAYFKSLIALLGSHRDFQFLSGSPKLIHLDLNEWIRFDKPGSYRVSVVSRRIGDVAAGNENFGGITKEIASNSIELQIIEPDPEWQRSLLHNALVELSRSAPARWLKPSDARDLALRQLRYLGSADAALEMARHLRGEETTDDWQYMFGLVGSPNRMAGLDEMRKLLVDPDFPVSEAFLNTISVLPLDPNDSPESLRKQWGENQKAARYTLLDVLPNKKGTALAMSLFTASDGIEPGAPPELRSKLLGEFVAHFAELSASQQLRWLDGQYPQSIFQPVGHVPSHWPLVRDPRLVPALRTIATQYTDFPQPNQIDAHEALEVSAIALIRWYELDPEGARPAVIAEIVRPKPRYSANTLGMLPDKVLLNEQHLIAEHFLATDSYAVEGNLASLLNRYADAAVLDEVLPKIKKKVGPWACIPEINAVAYVQRVDPEAAKPLSERVASTCQSFWNRTDLP
jgi:hypothetical protein